MALTFDDVRTKVKEFFASIKAGAIDQILGTALPLLGDAGALPAGVGDFKNPLANLEAQVIAAINQAEALSNPDVIGTIVDVINNTINVPEIRAAADGADGINLTFTENIGVSTGTENIEVGSGIGSIFKFKANVGAELNAALSVTLGISSTGDFSLVDTGTPELRIDLLSNIDLVDVDGNLGIATVKLTNADPALQEFEAHYAVDLAIDSTTKDVTATHSLTGHAGLDLKFAAVDVVGGILPNISGEFIVDFPISTDAFTPPTVTVKDVTIDLRTYLGLLKEATSGIADIFDADPLKAIIDLIVDPVEPFHSLLKKAPGPIFQFFDQVGGLFGAGGDGKITIVDLLAISNKELYNNIKPFYTAILIVDAIRQLDDLANGPAGDGMLNIGGGSLFGGTITQALDANLQATIDSTLNDLVDNIPSLQAVSDAVNSVKDFLKDQEITIPGYTPDTATNTNPVTFNLLDHPEQILDIILSTKTVDLVKYDVPPLILNAQAHAFIPILGPIGVDIGGLITAQVDIDVGYDTQGFADGSFEKGFFFATKANDGEPPGGTAPFEPVGHVISEARGGVGVGIAGIGSLTAGIGLEATLDAYFMRTPENDGKFRPLDSTSYDCIFDPTASGGHAEAFADVRIKIGFGPFSFTKTIPIWSGVIADFKLFECPPAVFQVPPDVQEGLATASGTDLLLNVGDINGDRGQFRQLKDEDTGTFKKIVNEDDPTTTINEAENESYIIGLARDKDPNSGINSNLPPVPIAGMLDVHAFGLTQRVGVPNIIKADFKNGDDVLFIQEDVAIRADVSGGAGRDNLAGGAGNDRLDGGDDDDSLIGSVGDDELIGGKGNDYLDGGKGADSLDGGEGIDSVDYSASNRDVGVGVDIFAQEIGPISISSPGSGGDAQGDTLFSIESIIGTDFSDKIQNIINSNVSIFGGLGNDFIKGGSRSDFLLGGEGADRIVGGAHDAGTDGDATSYASSWAAVDVDLNRASQWYGDAEGDILDGIESIQGSIYNDTITGNNVHNLIDGADGNDILDGAGGNDSVNGNVGDDIVYAHDDDSILDGGAGIRDLLSYERHNAGVTVDLGNSEIGIGSFFNTPDRIVMDIKATATSRGYSSFENLDGTNFADDLTGDLFYNTIRGLDGADIINGDGGHDRLIGGNGADALNGGDGFDWVEYGDSGAGVTVDLQGVGVGGTAQGDTYANVENILGSRSADRLYGNGSDNIIDPNLSPGGALELIDGRGGTDRMVLNFSAPDIDVGTGVIGGFGAGVQNGVFIHSNAASATLHEITFLDVEAMDFTGTKSADTVRAKSGNDNIVTGSGGDTIYSGTGADNVDAGRGNDIVYVGTDTNFALTDLTTVGPQLIDGGIGIDTLSISLAHATRDVVIAGYNGLGDFQGVNFTYDSGASVKNFETFKDVWTGSGDDEITQLGSINNDFRSGAGEDILRPGLGTDTVDGGLDLAGIAVPAFGTSFDSFAISDAAAFNNARGDRLVLDYSTLAGDVAIFGGGSLHSTIMNIGVTGALLRTNSGRYQAFANGNAVLTDEVSFDNIEGVTITGTTGNDFFSGTHAVFSAAFDPAGGTPEARGGDDVLAGGDGTDFLIGYSGDDTLKGDAGNDVLIGTEINTFDPFGGDGGSDQTLDDTELDELTGGSGADEFWLGDTVGAYYVGDTDEDGIGTYGKAIITDFNAGDGDIVQLFGDASLYEARANTDSGIDIVMTTPPGQDGEFTIATLLNTTTFDLDAAYVRYVPGAAAVAAISASITSSFAANTPPIADLSLSAAPEFLIDSPLLTAARADISAPADLVLPLVAPGWVTQDNDVGDLKAMLDGASGALPGSSLELNGSAESFGTFDGDPFGLGTGVILSTGYVEDLPGANTSGGVTSDSSPISINFNLLGRTGNNDIFVADISNLNIDIRSISLTDSGSRIGGLGGLASGFDIGAIALSRTLLGPITDGTDLDTAGTLPRIDAFDFTNASMHFTPGTQHTPGGTFPYGENFPGSVNSLVNADRVRFDLFNGPLYNDPSLPGTLTLGDGGTVGFDLKAPVSAEGPLFLYIAESGGTGEVVTGAINISTDTIEPTGDLSSDMGAQGLAGDDTSMTYRFTPKTGDTGFSMDVVLFTEEFPEYDGRSPTDIFSIKLNGVEIGALSNGAGLDMKSLNYSFSGDLIANAVGTGPLASDIKADAYTKTLTIGGHLLAGQENVLTVDVRDGRDAFLDSGLLVKTGSLKTFKLPDFNIEVGNGSVTPGGGPLDLELSLPDGTSLTDPVKVTIDPSGDLDLGNGPGNPVDVTFEPGGPGTILVPVTGAGGADPNKDGSIDFTVHSDDPNWDGLPIAPTKIDILPAATNHAPEITTPLTLVHVRENTASVVTVVANDIDAGQTLTYSISGGADKDLFKIDAVTGVLSFNSAPDYERPLDQGRDNIYDVVVEARDNGIPTLADTQDIKVKVDNAVDTTRLEVKFQSESAGYRSSVGWYNAKTLEGGFLFANVDVPPLTPGQSSVSFAVNSADVADINFFMIPNGHSLNSPALLQGGIKLVQNAVGKWEIQTMDGTQTILKGAGANAIFTEVSRNADGLDHVSSSVGTDQSNRTLVNDTRDGPTGRMAWEDIVGSSIRKNGLTLPGDGDFNDAVFNVKSYAGKHLTGNSGGNTLNGDDGDDDISGGGGNDVIKGRAGNDHIAGDAGNDTLTGGLGSDVFEFKLGFGKDVIKDFSVLEHDSLYFGAGLTPTPATAAGFLNSSAVTQAGDDVKIAFNANDVITLQNMTIETLLGNSDTLFFV